MAKDKSILPVKRYAVTILTAIQITLQVIDFKIDLLRDSNMKYRFWVRL